MRLPWLSDYARALGTALDQDRLGHAPLLHGPRGLGKIELAHWLVARILCLDESGAAPCGRCRSCTLLKSGTHPDLFVAGIPEDKSQIMIDIVRELCRGLQLTPSIGRRRVGLIEPAEAMNRNAANALLKTLEEPADRAWLVLVSDHAERLPATVRSRCQQVAIRPPDRAQALEWLRQESKLQQQQQRLSLALEAAGGAPCRALALIDDEGLDFGLAVREVLLSLAEGRPVAAAVADDWAARAHDAWAWIAHWVWQWSAQCLGLDPPESEQRLPMPSRADSLGRMWQQALDGQQLAGTAIRADLLIGKWLLEWSACFETGG